MVTPWSLTRSSIASATRLPIAHPAPGRSRGCRRCRRRPRRPCALSSSIGPASSSMRARMARVGLDARVEQHGVAGRGGHLAGVVEGRARGGRDTWRGAGLDDRHRRRRGRRPSAGTVGRVLVGVGEERVAVAADDRRRCPAPPRRPPMSAGRAEVAEDDDLLDPRGLERRHLVGHVGAGSRKLTVGPGDEISAVSGVVAPRIATFSPPIVEDEVSSAPAARAGCRR